MLNKSILKRVEFILEPQDTGCNRSSALEKFTWAYIFIAIVAYLLYLIAPWLRIISETPLYSFQRHLAAVGIIILIWDFLTERRCFRSRYVVFLYALCLVCLLSMVKMGKYGYKDNLFDFVWFSIQFGIFYSYAATAIHDNIKKLFKYLYLVVGILWSIACILSLIQFANGVGYRMVADIHTDNPELVRQGFWISRLFGIFRGIDYSAYVSLIIILASIYYFKTFRSTASKLISIFFIIPSFLYIILSYSRSAMLSLVISMAILTSYFCTSFFRKRPVKHHCLRTFIAVFLSALMILSIMFGVQKLAEYSLNKRIEENNYQIFDSQELDKRKTILILNNKGYGHDLQHKIMLNREELEENLFDSNGRYAIWHDYLYLMGDYGLLGLSTSNYNNYIYDHYKDLYITRYFQDLREKSGKEDLVYESHNNYLFVLVSTGYLGFLCFALFMFSALIFNIKTLIRSYQTQGRIDFSYVIALLIMIVISLGALFMNNAFLKINIVSFIFWLSLGFVMNKANLIRDQLVQHSNSNISV